MYLSYLNFYPVAPLSFCRPPILGLPPPRMEIPIELAATPNGTILHFELFDGVEHGNLFGPREGILCNKTIIQNSNKQE